MCAAQQLGAWAISATPRAVPFLVCALADTVPAVRRQALAALQFLWTPVAEAAALAALRDRDDTVRYIAAQLLGHPPDAPRPRRAVPRLDRRQHLGPRGERPAPSAALATPRAVAPLERMFAEREGPDHEAAKEALQLLTGLNYAVAP